MSARFASPRVRRRAMRADPSRQGADPDPPAGQRVRRSRSSCAAASPIIFGSGSKTRRPSMDSRFPRERDRPERRKRDGHRALRPRLHVARGRRHLRVDPLPDAQGRPRSRDLRARARALLRRICGGHARHSRVPAFRLPAAGTPSARATRSVARTVSGRDRRADDPAEVGRARRLARGARRT